MVVELLLLEVGFANKSWRSAGDLGNFCKTCPGILGKSRGIYTGLRSKAIPQAMEPPQNVLEKYTNIVDD
jgi:hypothetical protein